MSSSQSLPRPMGQKLYNRNNAFASKVDTILKTDKGSIYYFPELGASIGFFLINEQDFSVEVFNNFLVSELVDSGVNVLEITSEASPDDPFTLRIMIKGNLNNSDKTQTFSTIVVRNGKSAAGYRVNSQGKIKKE